MNRLVVRIGVLVWLLVSGGWAGADGQRHDYFHWQPAADARGWVVFLPGSDGLKVLDDDRHYFEVAARLNREGWSVLLVDYKAAYKAAGKDAEPGDTGAKIAWVTGRAVDWMHDEHPAMASLPGALVAWSLGAEGALEIASDPERCARMGLRAMAMYYPSNQGMRRLDNAVPVLVLTGARDDVVQARDVEALVRDRPPGARPAELHVYPDAHHGFDVASLRQKRVVRLLPLIGPKATLLFDEAAAADAETRLHGFLADHASP